MNKQTLSFISGKSWLGAVFICSVLLIELVFDAQSILNFRDVFL